MADNNNVELSVRSQLKKIIEELEAISNAHKEVQDEFKKTGEDVGKNITDSTKKTGNALSSMGERARSISGQIVRDFKALLSIEALTGGLKLSEQFKGSVKETIALSDAIRRLGPVFGMTQRQAESFQSKVASAMGEIGASSEEAANALGGLAQTPVKDEKQLIEYSKTAVKLGSIGGTPGRSGEIGKGLSDLVIARGGNPKDINQMKKVSDEVLKIMNATGQNAIQVQSSLSGLYASANSEFKPMLEKGGAASMAAAEFYGGPNASAFLQRYVKSDTTERARFQAQGTGNIIDKSGRLNLKAFEGILAQAKKVGYQGNAEHGLKGMFGLSDEEAKGFMRLSEALKNNKTAIEAARTAVTDINKQYLDTMSFGDAFRSKINRVKGLFSDFLSALGIDSITQKVTNMMAQDTSGAGAVASVAGGGILAAVLASGGLKGIGNALGGLGGLAGGAAKGKLMQETTGATPVYVVNASEIGGGGGALGGLAGAAQGGKGLMGKLGTLGAAAGAGYLGYQAATSLNENVVQPWLKESPTGQKVDSAMLNAITKLSQMLGLLPEVVQSAKSSGGTTRVMIENKTHDFKTSVKQPSRGPVQ